jgi:glutamate:GABA antiporter
LPLKRELGLRDLTLFAISCIVGTRWIAAAAHAGPGSLVLWVLAAVLFLIPLAIAVAVLTVKHPETGGLYRWTRSDFGPWHGFLAFWIYWIGIAFWFPSAAMFYASIVLSPLGLAENRTILVCSALALIWIALGTNIVGVAVGKWTENIGALASWVLGALLVIVAAIVWGRRGAATTFQLMPSAHWAAVSFWATIAYAMTGIEMAGFMAGEMRDPGRDVPRAAWISSAFTTVFYVAATAALLVVLRPDQISELNGLAQVVTSAGITVGASWLAPLTVLLVMATAIGQFGGIGSSVARMPFAAGVDHLFPAVFAKVHPRWNTPYVSMFVFGVLASAMLVLVQFGDSMRAAYQTLISLMVIAGFLPYVYMFASAWRAGRKLTAVLGQAMTALAIVCSVAPTEEIGNVWLFEFKIAAGTAAIILSGRLVYRRYSARTNSQWASSAPGR